MDLFDDGIRRNINEWDQTSDENTKSWKTYLEKVGMEWVPQPITRKMMANLNAKEVLRVTGFCLNFFDDIPYEDEIRLRKLKEEVDWYTVRYMQNRIKK